MESFNALMVRAAINIGLGVAGGIDPRHLPAALEAATRAELSRLAGVQAFFLSGFTGAGKSVLMNRLSSEYGFPICPKVFTRPARADELAQVGTLVRPMNESEFLERQARGEFAFSRLRNGVTWNGILASDIETCRASGVPFLFDGRSEGNIRAIVAHPACAGLHWGAVYLIPPSAEELLRRFDERRQRLGLFNEHEDHERRLASTLNDFPITLTGSVFSAYLVTDSPERVVDLLATMLLQKA